VRFAGDYITSLLQHNALGVGLLFGGHRAEAIFQQKIARSLSCVTEKMCFFETNFAFARALRFNQQANGFHPETSWKRLDRRN